MLWDIPQDEEPAQGGLGKGCLAFS
jgi:hypothetical protein